MKRAFVVLLLGTLLGATGQSNNQLLNQQDLVDNTTAAIFACTSIAGSQAVVTRTYFTAHCTNNGACQTASNATQYNIVFGDMTACKTAAVSSHVTALNGAAFNAAFCSHSKT